MKPEVRQAALWTVACALLFLWFVSFAAHALQQPPTSYTVIPKSGCQTRPANPRGLP